MQARFENSRGNVQKYLLSTDKKRLISSCPWRLFILQFKSLQGARKTYTLNTRRGKETAFEARDSFSVVRRLKYKDRDERNWRERLTVWTKSTYILISLLFSKWSAFLTRKALSIVSIIKKGKSWLLIYCEREYRVILSSYAHSWCRSFYWPRFYGLIS